VVTAGEQQAQAELQAAKAAKEAQWAADDEVSRQKAEAEAAAKRSAEASGNQERASLFGAGAGV
jgi:hypothetical protein